jgi:hypothetical protein
LIKGSYSALGQLNFSVGDRVGLAFTYVHGYDEPLSSPNGNTAGTIASGTLAQPLYSLGRTAGELGINGSPVVGTFQANYPSAVANQFVSGASNQAVTSNSYGVEVAIRPSNLFSISGYAEATFARILGVGDANIWSYGGGIAFPNFGKQGNLLGLFAGIEPTLRGLRIGNHEVNFGSRDNDYHVEGFYKYQLTDNISITPGVIWLTNPAQNKDNDNAIIGTLRTTFTF